MTQNGKVPNKDRCHVLITKITHTLPKQQNKTKPTNTKQNKNQPDKQKRTKKNRSKELHFFENFVV